MDDWTKGFFAGMSVCFFVLTATLILIIKKTW